MIREWDAAHYDSLPLPHQRWGKKVLDRLPLRTTDTVLDAGCGTGRDTMLVLQRIPSGKVIAIDGSARMLERIEKRLEGSLNRVEVVNADLTTQLTVSGPVDAAFNDAKFHW